MALPPTLPGMIEQLDVAILWSRTHYSKVDRLPTSSNRIEGLKYILTEYFSFLLKTRNALNANMPRIAASDGFGDDINDASRSLMLYLTSVVEVSSSQPTTIVQTVKPILDRVFAFFDSHKLTQLSLQHSLKVPLSEYITAVNQKLTSSNYEIERLIAVFNNRFAPNVLHERFTNTGKLHVDYIVNIERANVVNPPTLLTITTLQFQQNGFQSYANAMIRLMGTNPLPQHPLKTVITNINSLFALDPTRGINDAIDISVGNWKKINSKGIAHNTLHDIHALFNNITHMPIKGTVPKTDLLKLPTTIVTTMKDMLEPLNAIINSILTNTIQINKWTAPSDVFFITTAELTTIEEVFKSYHDYKLHAETTLQTLKVELAGYKMFILEYFKTMAPIPLELGNAITAFDDMLSEHARAINVIGDRYETMLQSARKIDPKISNIAEFDNAITKMMVEFKSLNDRLKVADSIATTRLSTETSKTQQLSSTHKESLTQTEKRAADALKACKDDNATKIESLKRAHATEIELLKQKCASDTQVLKSDHNMVVRDLRVEMAQKDMTHSTDLENERHKTKEALAELAAQKNTMLFKTATHDQLIVQLKTQHGIDIATVNNALAVARSELATFKTSMADKTQLTIAADTARLRQDLDTKKAAYNALAEVNKRTLAELAQARKDIALFKSNNAYRNIVLDNEDLRSQQARDHHATLVLREKYDTCTYDHSIAKQKIDQLMVQLEKARQTQMKLATVYRRRLIKAQSVAFFKGMDAHKSKARHRRRPRTIVMSVAGGGNGGLVTGANNNPSATGTSSTNIPTMRDVDDDSDGNDEDDDTKETYYGTVTTDVVGDETNGADDETDVNNGGNSNHGGTCDDESSLSSDDDDNSGGGAAIPIVSEVTSPIVDNVTNVANSDPDIASSNANGVATPSSVTSNSASSTIVNASIATYTFPGQKPHVVDLDSLDAGDEDMYSDVEFDAESDNDFETELSEIRPIILRTDSLDDDTDDLMPVNEMDSDTFRQALNYSEARKLEEARRRRLGRQQESDTTRSHIVISDDDDDGMVIKALVGEAPTPMIKARSPKMDVLLRRHAKIIQRLYGRIRILKNALRTARNVIMKNVTSVSMPSTSVDAMLSMPISPPLRAPSARQPIKRRKKKKSLVSNKNRVVISSLDDLTKLSTLDFKNPNVTYVARANMLQLFAQKYNDIQLKHDTLAATIDALHAKITSLIDPTLVSGSNLAMLDIVETTITKTRENLEDVTTEHVRAQLNVTNMTAQLEALNEDKSRLETALHSVQEKLQTVQTTMDAKYAALEKEKESIVHTFNACATYISDTEKKLEAANLLDVQNKTTIQSLRDTLQRTVSDGVLSPITPITPSVDESLDFTQSNTVRPIIVMQGSDTSVDNTELTLLSNTIADLETRITDLTAANASLMYDYSLAENTVVQESLVIFKKVLEQQAVVDFVATGNNLAEAASNGVKNAILQTKADSTFVLDLKKDMIRPIDKTVTLDDIRSFYANTRVTRSTSKRTSSASLASMSASSSKKFTQTHLS